MKRMKEAIQRIWSASTLLVIAFTSSAHAADIGWPQEITADSDVTVLVYQPQVEEFSGNALAGRAAVSVKNPSAGNVPVFGAIWFEARIDTSRPGLIRIVIRELRQFAMSTSSTCALQMQVTSKSRSLPTSSKIRLNIPISGYRLTSCSPTLTQNELAAQVRTSGTIRP
jgi:hypothetical protein